MRSVREDVTRWNTSCCGMEPSIIVIHAVTNPITSIGLNAGQNENLPEAAAWATTVLTPPAWPETSQPMYIMPITMMIIWMKSVTATDHIPPNNVYTSTLAAPIIMPVSWDSAPSDTV